MMQKYIGIDYGAKHVGIALSDESGTLAFPHTVLSNRKGLVDEIVGMVQDEGVVGVVIGESKNLRGGENPVMEAIHHFIKEFEKYSKLPVYLEAEFFTSAEAAREFGEDEMHDARAAALILQRFLDKHNQTQ